MKNPHYLEVGDEVEFKSRWAGMLRGVVVQAIRFAHCPGANSFSVYVPEATGVFGVDLFNTKKVSEPVDAAEAKARVDAARKHYSDHLAATYPAWRENFANGLTVGW